MKNALILIKRIKCVTKNSPITVTDYNQSMIQATSIATSRAWMTCVRQRQKLVKCAYQWDNCVERIARELCQAGLRARLEEAFVSPQFRSGGVRQDTAPSKNEEWRLLLKKNTAG